MTILTANGINDAWIMILKHLKEQGISSAPRGLKIIESKNFSIKITNPKKRILTYGFRKTSLPFAFGELLWYLSGRNDVEMMEYYSKRMRSFSDDGRTLNSAYGYRIFGKHPMLPFDQWKYVVDKLKEDPDTRQAVIHIKTPSNVPTKDEVCTKDLQFLIRDGKLDMMVNMRSNDAVWGFTYDVFSFTTFQELMANELGVEVGEYYHNAISMHLYEKDFHFLEWVDVYDDLIRASKYDKEFSYDGLTIYDDELNKLFLAETILRQDHKHEDKKMLRAVIEKIELPNDINNKAIKSIFEVLKLYALYKAGMKKKKLFKRINFNDYLQVMCANYFSGRSITQSSLLVLEGPDGVGKSTKAKELVLTKESPYDTIIHIPNIEPDKVFDKQIYFIIATMTGNVIMDRFFYSEVVYSNFYNRKCLLDLNDIITLETLLNKRQGEVVFLKVDDVEEHYSRLDKKDKKAFTIDDLRSLRTSYSIVSNWSNVYIKSN